VLAGRYAVHDQLGRGGASGVYLVHDRNLARWRAAKVLHRRFASNDDLRARFLREARTLARLDHPNIVRVFDVVDSDETPFMVMEFVSGGCVFDWVMEHGPMPPVMAVQVTLDVCRALAYTHETGVVHRDVKPQNVLVSRDGVGKLIDFGIAKLSPTDPARGIDDQWTDAGTSMGTDSFMAPEQRDDASTVDFRADIYATGAMLFALATRRSAAQLWTLSRHPERLEQLPASLREIVLRATSRDPVERYPSAAALEFALRDAQWDLPTANDAPQLVRRNPSPPDTPSGSISPAFTRRWDDLHSPRPQPRVQQPTPTQAGQRSLARLVLGGMVLVGMVLAALAGWWAAVAPG